MCIRDSAEPEAQAQGRRGQVQGPAGRALRQLSPRHTKEASPRVGGASSRARGLVSRRPEPRLCLLYTSDAADERSSVDLGGRRIIKKKKRKCRR